MTIYAELVDCSTCCGVMELGDFIDTTKSAWRTPLSKLTLMSGTGLVVTYLTKSKTCQEVEKRLKKKYQVLWESEYFPNLIHDDETEVKMLVLLTPERTRV